MRKEMWFEKLGYAYNPFIIKPGFFDDEVIGYDTQIDKLVELLKDGEMAFLEGHFGLGKTTILKYIINEFKGVNKVLYISRNRSDRAMNYTNLLKGASKGLKKFFKVKAKNTILIVDETAKINASDCDQIEEFYESGNFKSVLFVDYSLKEARLTKSVKTIIGENVVSLKPLTPKASVELARSRLEGNEELISSTLIKEVYELSENNTRRFLENLEDVCRHAIDAERTSVTKEDLDVLNKTKAPQTQAQRKSDAKKRDANLIAFTQDHEVDTVLKKFGIEPSQEAREQLKSIGLTWKKDAEWKPHNRKNFYAYVEKTNALETLSSSSKE
jgi:replication-associated recombination protein RarA